MIRNNRFSSSVFHYTKHAYLFQERGLVEAAYLVEDLEQLQCILEINPKCAIKLYIRDIKDEVIALNELMKKVRRSKLSILGKSILFLLLCKKTQQNLAHLPQRLNRSIRPIIC